MAVIQMQKLRFVVHNDDRDRLLSLLQRHGAMEFVEVNTPATRDVSTEAPHHILYARVQHAVHFLEQYEKKVGLWQSLREGVSTDLTETEISARAHDTDAVASIVDDLEELQVQYAEVTDQVRVLTDAESKLTTWKTLPIKLAHLNTDRTKTLLLRDESEDKSVAPLKVRVEEMLMAEDVTYALTPLSKTRLALTMATGIDMRMLETKLDAIKAGQEELPKGTEMPDVELTKVQEALAKKKSELGLVHDQGEHMAHTHLKTLRIAAEVLSWEYDRYQALASGRATTHTVVFDGWINAEKKPAIDVAISGAGIVAESGELPVGEEEEPPVDIKNSPFVEPFEVVTRLYGMPGHKDLDPTLFLAGFFFLFFGLSLTDVGYGVTLMVVSITILTLFKVAPVVRTFAKLLLFMGLGSFLVGLLFGGYLGVPPESLPPALQAIAIFDPIGNPLPVFYLALGLGVFQVMVGMLLKIYSDARNGKLVDGILDQGPWLFVFMIGIAYVGVVTGYLSGVTEAQLINLVYIGLIMVVLASGRKGKTLLEKAQKAALSLYDSIGYFSDILSYSRLLALGLATTALAFAVNLIAEIVSGSVPYIGPILAIVVLVIGHLFTLAVNTLGAFIHSARLQFVEFFGKFIAGTGREFKPLRRSYRYIAVKDK